MIPVRPLCLLIFLSAVFTLATIGIALYIAFQKSEHSFSSVMIDTDGGVDDIFAILMLIRADNVNIEGITTVDGITGIVNSTRNIRTLLTLIRKQAIPIYPGSEKRPDNTDKGYYGWDGFGDFLPKAASLYSVRPPASQVIVQVVTDNPGKITLLFLGPLTNLAEALKIQPYLMTILKQVIIVGASYKGGGNVGPGLEFNIGSDPSAAALVFNTASSEHPITLIPLETIESYSTFPRVWREDGLGRIPTKWTQFFNKAENISLNQSENWMCYDQTGASIIIEPTIILNKTYGVMAVDSIGTAHFVPNNTDYNVEIITEINKSLLKIFLTQALS